MEQSIHFPNLGVHLDRVGQSFRLGGVSVSFYGLLLAVGMLIGIYSIVMRAKRSGQDQNQYLSLVLIAGLAAVFGARLFYVVFKPEVLGGDFREFFHLRSGGFAFYGALLGGVLAVYVFGRIRKLSFWKMADTVCMGILIMQIIGRWGNFFNRESFGDYTDNLVAMQIPVSYARAGEITSQLKEHITAIEGVEFIQVHPVFLYESLWCVLLLLFLKCYRRHRKFSGELFLVYLGGYSLGRVWLEGLRTDQLLIPGTRIPVCQVIAGALVIFCFLDVVIQRVMTGKRRAAKEKEREQFYEAEEGLEFHLEDYGAETPDRDPEDFFEQENPQQEGLEEEFDLKQES